MLFGTKNKLSGVGNFNLNMGGEVLEMVESYKYLGILLDQHLNFGEHISPVYKKSSMKLGAIRTIRRNLDQSRALSLYTSLVLPHIDYCDIIYSCSTQENLNKLQLFQNCACRTTLLADRETHIRHIHTRLNLLYLNQRRDPHLAVSCHKSIYFKGLSSLSSFIFLSYVLLDIQHGMQTHPKGRFQELEL